jgi:MoaA/NifB/PqqE/SkfB family radical SAM enzyme
MEERLMLDAKLIRDYNRFRIARSKENGSRPTDTSVVCHAPFISLNFEQNGNATACCYNRSHVLGTYPEVSVSEMWFGGKANELREAIRALDFGKGCELCLVQLQSRNFTGTRMLQFDHLAGGPNGREYPRVMEFEITNVCNLECIMCNGYYSAPIRQNREHLPPLKSPYDAGFVAQLEPFLPYLIEAKFLGGEPFLIQRYWEIWERFLEVNPQVVIPVTTNGTMLTDRVRTILKSLDFTIVLSLDSIVRETYESIRLNADYDEVMHHLRYFLDYMHAKGEPLFVAVCPMQQNWREMPGMLDFANEEGARLFFNSVLYPESCSLRSLSTEELDEVLDCYRSVRHRTETRWQRQNGDAWKDLIHQLEQWRQIADEKEGIGRQLAAGEGVTRLSPSEWHLKAHEPARAILDRSDSADPVLRANLIEVPGAHGWQIELIHTSALQSGVRYCFRFRARAERPRSIHVVVGTASEPWTNLGLYKKVTLGTEWATYDAFFTSSESTDNARIYFELGSESASVEFADLLLARGAETSTALYEARYSH